MAIGANQKTQTHRAFFFQSTRCAWINRFGATAAGCHGGTYAHRCSRWGGAGRRCSSRWRGRADALRRGGWRWCRCCGRGQRFGWWRTARHGRCRGGRRRIRNQQGLDHFLRDLHRLTRQAIEQRPQQQTGQHHHQRDADEMTARIALSLCVREGLTHETRVAAMEK